MHEYENFMRHVFEHGVDKADRTGTGARSVFGYQLRFDLGQGFPLVTTKKLHVRSIIYELLWFLKGASNAPTASWGPCTGCSGAPGLPRTARSIRSRG